MGTDIHLFVEYQVSTAEGTCYLSLTERPFCLTRDYRFFGALSDIRGDAPLHQPRGLPADASDETMRAYYQIVSVDDGHDGLWQHVTGARADDYVARKVSHRRTWHGLSLVSDPDARSATWLDRPELFAALAHAALDPNSLPVDIRAMTAALQAIPHDCRPRIIFWFDN